MLLGHGLFLPAVEIARIGAILTVRQSAALHAGSTPTDAYLTGYRAGLLVAAALVIAGGIAAFLALRRATPRSTEPNAEYVLAA